MKNNSIYAWVGLVVKKLNLKDRFEIDWLLELASNCKNANSFFNCVKSLYTLKPDTPIQPTNNNQERTVSISQYDNTLSTFSKSTLSELNDDDK